MSVVRVRISSDLAFCHDDGRRRLPLLQWRGALCTNWLKMVQKIHSISNGSSRRSSFMQWIADWRPLKLFCWICVHMCFGHGNFRKMRLSNWKFTNQKQKGENGPPPCFQIVLASIGVLCAMLLGFYMTAAIACSSCAEFVRTALPTNRIVWYQVVVVSMYTASVFTIESAGNPCVAICSL